MNFKIILLQNGKEKKLIHSSKKQETAINKFTELKNKSETVLCPKRTLYDNENKRYEPVEYELILMEKTRAGEEKRDHLGRLSKDEWVKTKSFKYNYEEKFLSTDETKLNCREIYNRYINNDNQKQIHTIQNKLIIETDNKINLVICKTIEDAVRLHNTLQKHALKNKIKNTVFFGQTQRQERKKLWQRLSKKTNLSLPYLYKNTTR